MEMEPNKTGGNSNRLPNLYGTNIYFITFLVTFYTEQDTPYFVVYTPFRDEFPCGNKGVVLFLINIHNLGVSSTQWTIEIVSYSFVPRFAIKILPLI